MSHLPDPETEGPTLWASREVRPVVRGFEVDSYRGYRAEYPTPGQAWAAVAMILFVALGLIGALFAWALS